jgi:hypothetical protein
VAGWGRRAKAGSGKRRATTRNGISPGIAPGAHIRRVSSDSAWRRYKSDGGNDRKQGRCRNENGAASRPTRLAPPKMAGGSAATSAFVKTMAGNRISSIDVSCWIRMGDCGRIEWFFDMEDGKWLMDILSAYGMVVGRLGGVPRGRLCKDVWETLRSAQGDTLEYTTRCARPARPDVSLGTGDATTTMAGRESCVRGRGRQGNGGWREGLPNEPNSM